jgi:hypothetical protein
VAAQTAQSEQLCALLTYWAISTWCYDALSLAPGLCIVGPPHEGDLVLRTLRNYCRNSLMMSQINTTDLKKYQLADPANDTLLRAKLDQADVITPELHYEARLRCR